jgi:hypothetical protein
VRLQLERENAGARAIVEHRLVALQVKASLGHKPEAVKPRR